MSNADNKLISDIKEALDLNMQESAIDINISSKNGYVVLSGISDTLAEKRAAEEIASTIKGVVGITNNISLSTDGTFSDKETEAEVMSKLKGSGISASVHKGLAVLKGEAETLRDKEKAVHMAQKALGVKDIVSNIKISSSGRVDDASISNKLAREYVNNGLSVPDISSDVKKGIVRISGYVDTRHDMELAVDIAREIEGVTKVVNFLKLRKEPPK